MSSIKNIPNVSIAGFNYPIYAFDYNIGFAREANRIVVDFINEEGDFPDVVLSSSSFVDVQVNNASIGQFAPVRKRITKNQNSRTLQVTFVDKSIALDKCYVALRGQVAYDSADSFSARDEARIAGKINTVNKNLLIIGEEIDLCATEALETNNVDPCDPCAVKYTHPELRPLDCENIRDKQRKEYDYSLKELIDALPAKVGLNFSLSGVTLDEGDEAYRVKYSGNARQVLNNICSDLGLSFYYEGRNNTIVFFDLRAGININYKTLDNNPNFIKSDTNECSIDDTTQKMSIAYFGRDAEERAYNCGLDICRKLQAQPILLSDLLDDGAHFRDKPNEFLRLMYYSGLSVINKQLRDLVVWFQEYEVTDATSMESLKDKELNMINGMKIKSVLSAQSTGAELYYYHMLNRIYASDNTDDQKENKQEKIVFLLVESNDAYAEKLENFENGLMNQFIGQYFYRAYKEHFPNASYNYISPDSATYYDYNSPASLPFADVIREAYGNLQASPLFRKGDDSLFDSVPDTDGTVIKARDTFVLIRRNNSFIPRALDDEQEKIVNDFIEKYYFKEMATPAGLDLVGLNEDYDPKTYRILVTREFEEEVELNIDATIDHPEEIENVRIDVETCNKKTNYGLRGAECLRGQLKIGEINIETFHPPQAHEKSGTEHPGYYIIVGRSGDETNQILEKLEVFGSDGIPNKNEIYGSIDMNFINVTQENFEYIISDPTNFCKFDLEAIESDLVAFAKKFSYKENQNISRDVVYIGIPPDTYGPQDGLNSYSIRVGGSGFLTTLSFDTKPAYTLSPETYLNKLEYIKLKLYNQKQLAARTKSVYNANDLYVDET